MPRQRLLLEAFSRKFRIYWIAGQFVNTDIQINEEPSPTNNMCCKRNKRGRGVVALFSLSGTAIREVVWEWAALS